VHSVTSLKAVFIITSGELHIYDGFQVKLQFRTDGKDSRYGNLGTGLQIALFVMKL
jgi:hypothetical protein